MEGAHLLAKTKIWLIFFFFFLHIDFNKLMPKVKELYLELSMDRHEHDPHVQSNM
jgi:hypothetical protein